MLIDRPCKRCLERNKECIDVEAKRRGRKKFSNGSPSLTSTPQLENKHLMMPSTFPNSDSNFSNNLNLVGAELNLLSLPEFSDVFGDLFLFTPFENMETVERTKNFMDLQNVKTVSSFTKELNETPSTFSRLDFFAKLQERLRKR